MTSRAKPKFIDYGLLILLAAIFGSSFMFTKVAVAEIPAATLVFLRLVIAAAAFTVVTWMTRQAYPRGMKVWLIIVTLAFFGNALPFFLISWGQEKVDAGLAAILMATMPLLTFVIAHFVFTDEKLTPLKMVGFGLGLLGVMVIIGFDKLASLGEEVVRQYAISAAALCYALGAIITRSLVGLPRWSMLASILSVSALMLLPVSLMMDQPIALWAAKIPGIPAIAAACTLGLLATFIGNWLVFEIVNRQGSSFASQVNFLVPLFGVFWSFTFLEERLGLNALLAMGLIMGGLALTRVQHTKQKISAVEALGKEETL